MIEVKSIFLSKTVIGVVVAAIGLIAPMVQSKFGILVTGDDGVALLEGAAKAAESLGLVLALYGRVKATKKIG